MKASAFMLPVSLLLSVGLLGVVKIRKKELDFELKQRKVRELKMQVNIDLLEEGLKQATELQKRLEKTQKEIEGLTEKNTLVNSRSEQAKINYEDCHGDQKLFIDQIGETQIEYSTMKNSYEEERAEWKKEMLSLKEQLEGLSPLCKFLKHGAQQVTKLCNVSMAQDTKKKKVVMNLENPKKVQEAQL